MKVVKTINNNIVTCATEDGVEKIAMGRGLGYDFRPGMEVDQSRVEKVFSLDTGRGDTAKALFSNIPEDLLAICVRIIDYAKEALGTQLNDNVYLTLTDHINFAISKAAEGLEFLSAVSGEVKAFYPSEHVVGKMAIEMIEKEMGVRLPDSEACAIALHIVNAEYNTEIGSVMRITESISEVLEIITLHTGLEIHDDDIGGAALVSFLKFFVFRLFSGETVPDKAGDQFMLTARSLGPESARAAEAVARYLTAASHRDVPDIEKAILAENIQFYREYKRRR